MIKRVLILVTAMILCFTACVDIDYDTDSRYSTSESAVLSEDAESDTVSSADVSADSSLAESENSATSESSDSSIEESSAAESTESHNEDSSTAESSEEVSEDNSVDESSAVLPSRDVKEICAEIAAIRGNGFVSNIDNPAVAEKLDELEKYLEGKGYGFFYCDLEYNGYIAYDASKQFHTASTSKLPYIKYLATLVDKGEIDTEEKLVQLESYYDPGSGILKKNTPGKSYSVAKLMDYVLRYSDNIAYKMLYYRYGLSGFMAHLKTLGVNFSTYNGYGYCTATEMAAMLFDVAMYEGATLGLIKNAGCNASYNVQFGAELKEYQVLQKYGVIKPTNLMYHDIAIVYAPHPYIIVMYTNINYDSSEKNVPFRTVGRLVEEINSLLYGE